METLEDDHEVVFDHQKMMDKYRHLISDHDTQSDPSFIVQGNPAFVNPEAPTEFHPIPEPINSWLTELLGREDEEMLMEELEDGFILVQTLASIHPTAIDLTFYTTEEATTATDLTPIHRDFLKKGIKASGIHVPYQILDGSLAGDLNSCLKMLELFREWSVKAEQEQLECHISRGKEDPGFAQNSLSNNYFTLEAFDDNGMAGGTNILNSLVGAAQPLYPADRPNTSASASRNYASPRLQSAAEEDYEPAEGPFLAEVRWLVDSLQKLVSEDTPPSIVEELNRVGLQMNEKPGIIPAGDVIPMLTFGAVYHILANAMSGTSINWYEVTHIIPLRNEPKLDRYIMMERGFMDTLSAHGFLDFKDSLRDCVRDMVGDRSPFYESIHANIIEALMSWSTRSVTIDHIMSHLTMEFDKSLIESSSYPYDLEDALKLWQTLANTQLRSRYLPSFLPPYTDTFHPATILCGVAAWYSLSDINYCHDDSTPKARFANARIVEAHFKVPWKPEEFAHVRLEENGDVLEKGKWESEIGAWRPILLVTLIDLFETITSKPVVTDTSCGEETAISAKDKGRFEPVDAVDLPLEESVMVNNSDELATAAAAEPHALSRQQSANLQRAIFPPDVMEKDEDESIIDRDMPAQNHIQSDILEETSKVEVGLSLPILEEANTLNINTTESVESIDVKAGVDIFNSAANPTIYGQNLGTLASKPIPVDLSSTTNVCENSSLVVAEIIEGDTLFSTATQSLVDTKQSPETPLVSMAQNVSALISAIKANHEVVNVNQMFTAQLKLFIPVAVETKAKVSSFTTSAPQMAQKKPEVKRDIPLKQQKAKKETKEKKSKKEKQKLQLSLAVEDSTSHVEETQTNITQELTPAEPLPNIVEQTEAPMEESPSPQPTPTPPPARNRRIKLRDRRLKEVSPKNSEFAPHRIFDETSELPLVPPRQPLSNFALLDSFSSHTVLPIGAESDFSLPKITPETQLTFKTTTPIPKPTKLSLPELKLPPIAVKREEFDGKGSDVIRGRSRAARSGPPQVVHIDKANSRIPLKKPSSEISKRQPRMDSSDDESLGAPDFDSSAVLSRSYSDSEPELETEADKYDEVELTSKLGTKLPSIFISNVETTEETLEPIDDTDETHDGEDDGWEDINDGPLVYQDSAKLAWISNQMKIMAPTPSPGNTIEFNRAPSSIASPVPETQKNAKHMKLSQAAPAPPKDNPKSTPLGATQINPPPHEPAGSHIDSDDESSNTEYQLMWPLSNTPGKSMTALEKPMQLRGPERLLRSAGRDHNDSNEVRPTTSNTAKSSSFSRKLSKVMGAPDKAHSNRQIIKNALTHRCLAGAVNAKELEGILAEMEKSESSRFIILFRGQKDHGFRGLYSYDMKFDTVRVVRNQQVSAQSSLVPKHVQQIPEMITPQMVNEFFKYDSGSRSFNSVPTRSFGMSVHAVVLRRGM